MPSVAIVIPTFNEPELLLKTVNSIECPEGVSLRILVANAGDPLPPEFSSKVEEIKIDSRLFWAGSVQAGFNALLEDPTDFVMMLNADTSLLAGTLKAQLEFLRSRPKTVAFSPAYVQEGTEIRLLYSHQTDGGFLLWGKLQRPWTKQDEAPIEPFEAELHGGQGALFSTEILTHTRLDVARFPHYTGDHDFWLTLRKKGYQPYVIPQAGVVNQRDFGAHSKKGWKKKLAGLKKRMFSPYMGESIPALWRLRQKHLPFPLAVISFLVVFLARWTIGLKNTLKRL